MDEILRATLIQTQKFKTITMVLVEEIIGVIDRLDEKDHA